MKHKNTAHCGVPEWVQNNTNIESGIILGGLSTETKKFDGNCLGQGEKNLQSSHLRIKKVHLDSGVLAIMVKLKNLVW